jgi:PIN domain nuclease of toxin-antitoxin system
LRLLLDTNVLLWVAAGDVRVMHLRDRIIDPDNEVFVSAATYWEIAIKTSLGKLAADLVSLRQQAVANGYVELPVLGVHAEMLGKLPLVHKDPFDRLLAAQAMAEPMRLLTSDRVLTDYSANVELI